MRRRSQAHLSTRGALAAVAAAALATASACHKDTIVTTRTVYANVPAACAVTGDGYATYEALGDYEAPLVQPGPFFRDVGTALAQMDAETRELVLTASQSGGQWAGVAPVPQAGDVNVLLMPEAQSCRLTGKVSSGSATRTGSTLAPIGSGLAMLTGGTGGSVPRTYVADLSTGEVTLVSADVQTERTAASVTPFGEGGLVAGGTSFSGEVQNTAEVYSASMRGFDRSATLQLSEPRTHHGAVVVAKGWTLLVGGSSDAVGKSVLKTIEIVDPAKHTAQEEGLLTLRDARRDPAVVHLASDAILVAGGFDGSGAPVGSLEWFSFDATTRPVRTQTGVLPAATGMTLAALPGGGALAVLTGTAKNVWVIDASGLVEPATPIPATVALTSPRLFDGGGGAPILWTGTGWLRWQPYDASFALLSTSDTAPPDVGDATCSADTGLAMWLDPGKQQLAGLRFDTRNPFSSVAPGGAVDFATETAPDRLASPGVLSIDAASEHLALTAPGASAFVTDRTYADVSIQLTLQGGAPPIVVLRDPISTDCAQPPCELTVGTSGLCTVTPGSAPVGSLDVERRGATVTWAVNGGSPTACSATLADGARVSIGLRAAAAPASVATFFVKRVGTP